MLKGILTAAFLMAIAIPARADAIDGDWCSPEGKHLTIKGPEITTPDKITLRGNYRRHEFYYVEPEGGADAGTQVYLNLLNDEEMNFQRTSKDGKLDELVIWRRCKVVS